MGKPAQKIISGLFLAIVIAFSLVRPAQAVVDISPEAHERAIISPNLNVQSFDQQQLGGFINSGTALIIGCTSVSRSECQNVLGDSAVGVTGKLIATLYLNQPVSGIQYFADVASRLKLAKPAYAQGAGVGFDALRPIREVWRAFRNFAYILLTVAFVGMGLAVMFRVKLSPQTVITIQSAIPRAISALLLITFSYAIAGLLVDFMYVLIGLFVVVLSPVSTQGVQQTQQFYSTAGFWQVTEGFLGAGGGTGAANELSGIFGKPVSTLLDTLGGFLLPKLVGGDNPLGTIIGIVGAIAGALYGAISGKSIVITFVFSIMLLFALFRVFILLMTSYVRVVLGVILGPLQILLDVIPGQSGFGGWLRNLFANILVFPLTMILLLLGTVLNASTRVGQSGWSPPGLGGLGVDQAVALLTFGILLLLPNIVGSIRDAIAGRSIFDFKRAMGEAAGPGISAISAGVGRGWARRQAPGQARRKVELEQEALADYNRRKTQRE